MIPMGKKGDADVALEKIGRVGISPICPGAGVIIVGGEDEGFTSVVGASDGSKGSDGTMLDVQGFEGIKPGGREVRGADGMRPVNPGEGTS
jgi:hypothetical protein